MSVRAIKSALLIAFHFPPMQGSSGLQRTLGFARHLPEFGWRPVVLAPHKMAFQNVDLRQNSLLPEDLIVLRSFSLDAARHLSVFGRYPDRMAVPDRWVSWVPGAVLMGLRAIRRYRPSVLWSTYPIATSHIIGRILSQISGLPWVADFRDPMIEKNSRTGQYAPRDPRVRNARLKIEGVCANRASALVFCTEWARKICLERHSSREAGTCHVISNGFEEAFFAEAEDFLELSEPDRSCRPFLLVHSGTIYPTTDRDPRPFLDAIENLKKKNIISATSLSIVLRATGHDKHFEPQLRQRNIQDIVALEPPLPYVEALAEMISSDGLLLFQGYTSNPAVPAKLYEYLRAKRPILALVDPAGSTAKVLSDVGVGVQVSIEDLVAIEIALKKFIQMPGVSPYSKGSSELIDVYSRAMLTGKLASIFDAISK